MKNSFTILAGLALMATILAHMFCYQVRYDQVAVRTTFDRADDQSVQSTPGLKWRLPWPIHKVTHYSKRLQLLEDKIEELQTADGKSVIVRTYLTWRIANPLDFYITLKDPDEASRQLSSRLREIRGVISRYRLDELVNLDRSRLKLATIEEEAKAALEASLADSGYGLRIENVGIHKLVLPEATTEKVFETMITTRERLAENAIQEGQAQASAIRSEAKSSRDRILAFAERRAQTIRSEGDRDAAEEYESFAQNEEFAIFLRKVQALETMLDHNTTFVLSADSLGILDWFSRDPGSTAATQAPRADAANPDARGAGESR
ncbi:MAG: protease modulator HflC [Pirellulales bacterium]|nr:protease modulator HflC [Pirellulales bacterium]MBL7193259.1 protease modulator HflC [Pirellulales bacterium]MDA0816765.1 protease modulator HflC [Planctomycetota bacterium]MDA0970803.1 protease modulator HflC [Planctomycetota bacterium]